MANFAPAYVGLSEVLADIAAARQAGQPVKVAVTLTGGGARGAWEAGVAEALLSAGLRPDLIVGTSAGALVALALHIDLMFPAGNAVAPFIGRQSTMWRELGVGNNGASRVVDHPWVIDLATFKVLGDAVGTTLTLATQVKDAIDALTGSVVAAGVAIGGGVAHLAQLLGGDLALAVASLRVLAGNEVGASDLGDALARLGTLVTTAGKIVKSIDQALTIIAGSVSGVGQAIDGGLAHLGQLAGDPSVKLHALQTALVGLARQIGVLEKMATGLAIQVVQQRIQLRESVLEFTELPRTLSRYLDAAMHVPSRATGGQRPPPLVSQWLARPDAPELILTSTDLTAQRMLLFGLVREPTVRSLLAADMWFVDLARGGGQRQKSPPTQPSPSYFTAQPAPADLDADLLRAAVTSSSIPVAFPPQRWKLERTFNKPGLMPVKQPGEHLVVDGGVVDNSPIDVAVTAGATHILSIELTPLFNPALDDPSAVLPPAPRFSLLTMPGALLETFMTGANRSAVNRLVAANAERRDDDPAKLQLYRLAPLLPASASISTLDFNGSYTPGGQAIMNLHDWFVQGYLDARDWGERRGGDDASVRNDPVIIDYRAPAQNGFVGNARALGNRFWRASVQAMPPRSVPPVV